MPHPDAPVFLELKKKCEGVVYKRRVTVSQSYEGLEGSTVTITGGSTFVRGPASDGDGSLDFLGTGTVSGGVVLCTSVAGGMGGSGAGRPDGMGFSPDQQQAPQKMG